MSLSSVMLETACECSHRGFCAFWKCSPLSSISITSSVQFIEEKCFGSCDNPRFVRFEAGFRLSRFERNVLFDCPSLKAISIPALAEGLFAAYQSKLHIVDPSTGRKHGSR
jgi:hypothetical protein